ncbi:hypothetical protein OG889_32795 [Streptomyces sp. NBC_00481]|uniref:hypothetical protein n=1 Tax=Streptomyces sp. NBC_00481 TaxID=2975755 RepID=UPI002DD8ED2A|nr:hypothetical protein [Streptomyces sp. NBC_00481]WRY99052.1 hypothetical protein OG889_32795 [Streptomyces sp. NBC_00481]
MYVSKTEQVHCPGCRALRPVRILGTAAVGRRRVRLAHCLDPACDLVWSVRNGTSASTSSTPEGTPAEGAARQGIDAGHPAF